LTVISGTLGSPAASQGQLDDAFSTPNPDVANTLGIEALSPDQLADLRTRAIPSEPVDPWSSGSSVAESWTLSTAANLAAQHTEMVRLSLEADAAVGRIEVSGWHYAAATNREQVVADQLTALVVDSFVNGESDELDKLTGSQARIYIDSPIEVATETLSAARERLDQAALTGQSRVLARQSVADVVRTQVRLQEHAVEEARQFDSAARRVALDHPIAIRDRQNQTLEVSGEPPETVVVGGFSVSPTIAGQLAEMLAAAAEAEISFGGWGYRSTEEQIHLRITHCGETGRAIFDGPSPDCSPPTARPLHSQHELGLALDFTESGQILQSGSPGFLWLQENAATYGFFNLPSEPWHWSTTGH
jgi:LAS superfamily LD-carboxypeptidase LdcB